MLYQLTLQSLRKKPLLSLLVVLMLSLGLFLIIGSTSYYSQNETKLSRFYEVYRQEEYRYYSQLVSWNQGDLNPERLNATREYIDQMYRSETFEAYTFYLDSLSVLDYKGPDNCLDGYEHYKPRRNTVRGLETATYYSAAAAYFLDPALLSKLGLTPSVGSGFADFDTLYTEGTTIPVIMGWDYHDSYRLNETFTGCVPGFPERLSRFEVVGFLAPGTAILSTNGSGETLSLSNRILCPALRLDNVALPEPQTDAETVAFNIRDVLLNQQSSFLVFSPSAELSLADFGNQTLIGTVSVKRAMILTSEFMAAANAYFEMLLFASVLILCGTTLCLSLNITGKMLASFKHYAVHLVCGATLNGICRMMIAEVGFLILLSDLLAFLAAALFGSSVFSYSQTTLFGIPFTTIGPTAFLSAAAVSLGVLFLSLFYPLLKLRHTEFDRYLRGRDT